MAGPLNPHMIANAPKLSVRYLHPSDVFHMVEKFVHVRFGGKEACIVPVLHTIFI
jgi:hypothetical protein